MAVMEMDYVAGLIPGQMSDISYVQAQNQLSHKTFTPPFTRVDLFSHHPAVVYLWVFGAMLLLD